MSTPVSPEAPVEPAPTEPPLSAPTEPPAEPVQTGLRRPSSPTARGAVGRVVELMPLALVCIAEAAWISVVGGLVQEFTLHQPEIGIAQLAVIVAIGATVAHVAAPRLGRRWPAVALVLVIAAGLAGLLASGAARASLSGGLVAAMAAHPGGLLAGLAMLRGFAHSRLPLAERTLTRLLAFGAPGLAFAALLGGIIVEPYRGRFLADSLAASILFIGSTVLALAFARLGAIGDQRGIDWRRNPAWLALSVLLLIGVIAASLPLAAIAGTAIPIFISITIGPALILGLAAGLPRWGRRLLIFLGIIVGFLFLRSLFGPPTSITTAPNAGTGIPETPNPDAERMMTLGIGGIVVVVVVAVILLLIALWMRRNLQPDDDPVDETRVVDRGFPRLSVPRRRRRFGRRPPPVDAVAAYVALLAELDGHEMLRRGPGETPIEHAARLRERGASGLGLELLAADYGLVRDGGRTLTPREDHRAIERWRTLRRSLPGWEHRELKLAEAAVDDGTRDPTILRRFVLLRDDPNRGQPGRGPSD
jgi:hypothetical protein